MSAEPKVKPDLTFSLAKILSNLSTAKMMAEVMKNETTITGSSKDMFSRIANRCRCAMDEINDKLTPASQEIIKSKMMNPEYHLQIDNLTNMMIALPEGIRNEIEDYALARYNIYAQKVNNE